MTQKRVALFVTCLVHLCRPSVGFAAISLLEAAGCLIECPKSVAANRPTMPATAKPPANWHAMAFQLQRNKRTAKAC